MIRGTTLWFFLLGFFLFSATCAKQASLKIETLTEGDCTHRAQKGDNLQMHYEGTLEDGTEFDSSYKRNSPFGFTLGTGMVIKGWDQGLEGMCKGEKRVLTIPSHLAYGDRGFPPQIPAKATLRFKVELLSLGEEEKDL